MALSRTDRIDTWLRAQGLPYLVPRERRGDDLLQRTSPGVVLLAVPLLFLSASGAGVAAAFDGVGDALGEASTVLLVLILVLAVALPAVLAWRLHHAMILWSDANGRGVALAVAAAYLALSAVAALVSRTAVWQALVESLVLLLLAHAVVHTGLGSLVTWAARWAVTSLRGLTEMASRALPVILVLVVFAFFSTESWQIADNMGTRRQLLLTVVIAVIAVLAMLPVARAELTTAHRDLTADEARRLLKGSPLDSGVASEVSGGALSGSGRLNALAVLVLAHLIQAAMFTLVIATLLITIGRIAITDTVVKSWLNHPRVPYTFLGDPLPVDHQTVHAAFLLGVIGALSFVLTSLSDANYRQVFFDPLVEGVKVAVAAHRALAGSQSK